MMNKSKNKNKKYKGILVKKYKNFKQYFARIKTDKIIIKGGFKY